MRRLSLKHSALWLAVILFPLMISTQARSTPSGSSKLTNGEFTVYIFKDRTWQKAGSLDYDQLFTEKELPLDNYVNEPGKVIVTIVERGGGAAHIDSVFLGGVPPDEVRDVDDGIKKLSKKDFDVIDAFEKAVTMGFDTKAIDKTMKLTARIESKEISKTPFQFPPINTGKLIGSDSQFYSYKLNSERGELKLDGSLHGVSEQKPFFKEYCWTGSGHPSGYTYGWVRNDDKNLYVAIDFTPDNTMDGDKDYSKVYIKTGSGIKEYKVSVPETKWGNAGFIYSNKVEYQHKVYEFKIPFRDVYDNDTDKKDELQIAFAAYGTANPNEIGIYLSGTPANTGDTFSYNSNILVPNNFNLINNNLGPQYAHIFASVPPGTYTFTQSLTPLGWMLTGITCFNNRGPNNAFVNLATRSVAIPFVAGDGYTCNFENQEAAIYVCKGGPCNCDGHNPCLHNIQNGIASASAPTVIEITQETYNEIIALDFNQLIFVRGGWDTNFTSRSYYTTIQGSITVNHGTMIIENIILE